MNIEVEDDRVLLGAYEDGKIARRKTHPKI